MKIWFSKPDHHYVNLSCDRGVIHVSIICDLFTCFSTAIKPPNRIERMLGVTLDKKVISAITAAKKECDSRNKLVDNAETVCKNVLHILGEEK